jgi:hypothetical protein
VGCAHAPQSAHTGATAAEALGPLLQRHARTASDEALAGALDALSRALSDEVGREGRG